MGRKRAIAQLTKIYEATHPVVEDPDRTPSRHRIYSQIRKLDEDNGNKRKAAKPRKGTQPAAPAAPVQQRPAEGGVSELAEMTKNILEFLRAPQNHRLYNEVLTFQTFMLVSCFRSSSLVIVCVAGSLGEGLPAGAPREGDPEGVVHPNPRPSAHHLSGAPRSECRLSQLSRERTSFYPLTRSFHLQSIDLVYLLFIWCK